MHFQIQFFACLLLCALFASCKNETPNNSQTATTEKTIPYTSGPITLDGQPDEAAWDTAEWQTLDQVWIGKPMEKGDFSGRFKTLWDENFLYVLAEIEDDTLIDIHEDGLLRYWDDDCLEIFVDENADGGNHQYNHSAFAYHLSLNGRVVDVAPDSTFTYYDEHCTFKRTCSGKLCIWEVAVRLFPDSFVDGGENTPVALSDSKEIGFALAYCDNDYSEERENFIGSVFVEGEDKNRGWIDAGIFEKVRLVK